MGRRELKRLLKSASPNSRIHKIHLVKFAYRRSLGWCAGINKEEIQIESVEFAALPANMTVTF